MPLPKAGSSTWVHPPGTSQLPAGLQVCGGRDLSCPESCCGAQGANLRGALSCPFFLLALGEQQPGYGVIRDTPVAHIGWPLARAAPRALPSTPAASQPGRAMLSCLASPRETRRGLGMVVGDSCEPWLLAGALPWGEAGLGAGQQRLAATFTPGLGRIRLSPRRGSVSRASITLRPLSPSWAAGQRREEAGLPAESRPGWMRDLSCCREAGLRHGPRCGTRTGQRVGLPGRLPWLGALSVPAPWCPGGGSRDVGLDGARSLRQREELTVAAWPWHCGPCWRQEGLLVGTEWLWPPSPCHPVLAHMGTALGPAPAGRG